MSCVLQSDRCGVEADAPSLGNRAADHHTAHRRPARGNRLGEAHRHHHAHTAGGHEEGARAKQFSPAVKQGDAARAETESFLGKVYGGSLGLMMSAMVEGCALTREDIDELSAILEQAGGNSK